MTSVVLPPEMLKVSVIIPAYRAATTIDRAVQSVLSQTYSASEIIVVDDDSPDDLKSVLAKYGKRVTYIRQRRGGASAARNSGIARSSGDLIAFLDADDEWLPEKLSRSVDAFREHPEIGLVTGRYFLQDEVGTPVRIAGPEGANCGRPIHPRGIELLELVRTTSTVSVVVRRDLLRHDQFDTTLATAEDRDLWLRLIGGHGVFAIPEPLAIYHVSEGSLSNSDIDVDCACMLRVLERYRHVLGTLESRKEKSYLHLKWAIGSERTLVALSHWLRAIWLWPIPYDHQRVRCHFARFRTLVKILRRSLKNASLAHGVL